MKAPPEVPGAERHDRRSPRTRLAAALVALLGLSACGARTAPAVGGDGGPAPSADGAVDAGARAPRRRTLSMAWSTACAIHDGAVFCWGDNALGVAGPDAPLRAPPTRVPGLDGAVEVGVGQLLACALDRDGAVSCWGAGVDAAAPTRVAGLPLADRLVVGSATACVITRERTVACTGNVLGTSSSCEPLATASLDATRTIPLEGVVDLAIGHRHVCAALSDGTVRCWGCGGMRELGDDTPFAREPNRVEGVDAIALAAETNATCALRRDGGATCWGDGSQFGTSLTFAPTAPRDAPFLAGATDLDVGVVFACGAHSGEVRCRGSLFDFGSGCGDRAVDARTFAVPGVTELSIGFQDACARDAAGEVWCWGCNAGGALGGMLGVGSAAPVRVAL